MKDIFVINQSTKYPSVSIGRLLKEPQPVPDNMLQIYVRKLDVKDNRSNIQYMLQGTIEYLGREPSIDIKLVEPMLIHKKETIICPPGTFSMYATVIWIVPRGDANWKVEGFEGNKLFYHLLNKDDQIRELQGIIKIQQKYSERTKELLNKIMSSLGEGEIAKEIAKNIQEYQNLNNRTGNQT